MRDYPKKAIYPRESGDEYRRGHLSSYAKMTSQKLKFSVVTSAYHVFRALLIIYSLTTHVCKNNHHFYSDIHIDKYGNFVAVIS